MPVLIAVPEPTSSNLEYNGRCLPMYVKALEAAGAGLRRHLPALGEPVLVDAGKPEEAVLAPGGDRRRRAIGPEEIVDVEFIERDQARDAPRHLRMSRERAVLGARQRQPRLQFGKGYRGAGEGGRGKRQNRERRIHATSASRSI